MARVFLVSWMRYGCRTSRALEASGPDQTGDITSDAPMYFGDRFAGERDLEGLIDEVALYNGALSDDEVMQNYEAIGLAVEPSGKLSLYWGEIKVLR